MSVKLIQLSDYKKKETSWWNQDVSPTETQVKIDDIISNEEMLDYLLFHYKELCADYFGKSVFQKAIDELQFEDITISPDRTEVDIYFPSMKVTKKIHVWLLSYDDKLLLNLVDE